MGMQRKQIAAVLVASLLTAAGTPSQVSAHEVEQAQTQEQSGDVEREESTGETETFEFNGRITTEVTNRWLTIYFACAEVPPMNELERV